MKIVKVSPMLMAKVIKVATRPMFKGSPLRVKTKLTLPKITKMSTAKAQAKKIHMGPTGK